MGNSNMGSAPRTQAQIAKSIAKGNSSATAAQAQRVAEQMVSMNINDIVRNHESRDGLTGKMTSRKGQA